MGVWPFGASERGMRGIQQEAALVDEDNGGPLATRPF